MKSERLDGEKPPAARSASASETTCRLAATNVGRAKPFFWSFFDLLRRE